MKFYYFATIALGIMLLFTVAGVDGIGTNVRNLMINNDSVIQPDTQYNYSGTDATTVANDIKASQNNLWKKFLIALLAIAVIGIISGVHILGSNIGVDGVLIAKSAIAYTLFGFFASDMWSLLTLVFSTDNGWVAWFLTIMITIFLFGFAFSALEFTGGTD